MVDVSTIVIQGIKFGYERYGAKGAVAAAIAMGASYAVIKKVVPKFTDIDEERIDEIYERVADDEELVEILGDEFSERFGEYFDDDFDGAAGTPTTD